jgi:DNA polymerase-3 subunit epsilon
VLDKQFNKYRKGRRNLAILCEDFTVPLTDAHAADADALAAARLAWRMASRNDVLGHMELFELHELQIQWAAEQAAELQDYFASQGRIEQIEGTWPVVPFDRSLQAVDQLAA